MAYQVMFNGVTILIMQWTLTCPNGKEIDMTHYIGEQMDGKLTRQDVLERIEYYKLTNKK